VAHPATPVDDRRRSPRRPEPEPGRSRGVSAPRQVSPRTGSSRSSSPGAARAARCPRRDHRGRLGALAWHAGGRAARALRVRRGPCRGRPRGRSYHPWPVPDLRGSTS
jgi:hypothetical protein